MDHAKKVYIEFAVFRGFRGLASVKPYRLGTRSSEPNIQDIGRSLPECSHCLKGLQQKRNLRDVKKLIFILNVGIDYRGTFVSSASKSGCHWALAVVDIAARGNPTTIYCDSLGWECPQNFGTCVQPFLQFFGCGVPSMLVALAHDTTAQNGPHQCTHLCLNYPLQTCGNVCGVIAVIAAVIAAQDD
ncbi:uncharacterized protein LOC143283189 [Babylonia areolata]|uniref:uncharacterized protein LOC143283189 n=1 Tax=Babylonia areolata TaxID=304850 RepID=UPI003FD0FB58